MQVSITLYSILRDLLPAEAQGRAVMDLPCGSRLADLRGRLALPKNAVFALNGQIERDENCVLSEGDHVSVFRASAGGSGEAAMRKDTVRPAATPISGGRWAGWGSIPYQKGRKN